MDETTFAMMNEAVKHATVIITRSVVEEAMMAISQLCDGRSGEAELIVERQVICTRLSNGAGHSHM
jgi:hypothetical protein